jgi:putative membrane protein
MENGVIGILTTGLPVLLAHFAVTLALLGVGVACYNALTPFHEWGWCAKGTRRPASCWGATSCAWPSRWPRPWPPASSPGHRGLGHRRAARAALGLRRRGPADTGAARHDRRGNTAAACMLVGIQVAVALLNAGAMAG